MSLFHKRLRQLNITNNSWLQAFAQTLHAANESPRTGGCNSQAEIYNLKFFAGVLAQLVERLNGIEEVTGSNPVGSIFLFCSVNNLDR